MLILSRQKDERIIIGHPPNQVVVMVVDIRDEGRRVRLGIDAPPDWPVDREEIYRDKYPSQV